MALLLPVFLLCVMATLDMSRAIYTYTVLSNAVREGCRVAVVETNTNQTVMTAVLNAAVGINLTPQNVTITGSRTPGTTVTVSASLRYTPITPIIRQIVPNGIMLTAVSNMVVD